MKQREKEFFKKRDQAEKDVIARVGKYEKEIEGIKKELKKFEEHLKADKEAYLKQIAEHEKTVELEISNQNKIRAAFHEGQLSAGDYQKNYREPAEIERTARLELAKKLKPIREAIQKKSAKWIDRRGRILEINEKIRIILEEHLKKNVDFLDLQKRELEKFRSYTLGTNIPMANREDWKKIQIARKGAYPEPLIIDRIESMEALEKIMIGGVIQPHHFDMMDQVILTIKQDEEIDFAKSYLRLTYTPTQQYTEGPSIRYAIIKRP